MSFGAFCAKIPFKETRNVIDMIEHHIIREKNYAYIVIKQSPDLDAFIHASRIFINDPDYSPELHRICDFSQADLTHITEEDFSSYVNFAREEIKIVPETKVALVAPGENKAGIFIDFANKMDSGRYRVFYQPEDAVAWIAG